MQGIFVLHKSDNRQFDFPDTPVRKTAFDFILDNQYPPVPFIRNCQIGNPARNFSAVFDLLLGFHLIGFTGLNVL